MATPFLRSLAVEGLTTDRVWSSLPVDLRLDAAKAFYVREKGGSAHRQMADAAIARAIRFREVSVRGLPPLRRAEHLARSVRPDDRLASALLLALHLELRRPLLAAFLDALGIPHEQGAILEDHETAPPPPERLAAAAIELFSRFPEDHVEIYFASLLAMDRETWGGLESVLRNRGSEGSAGGGAAALQEQELRVGSHHGKFPAGDEL